MKKKGFWESGYYDPDFSSVCISDDKIYFAAENEKFVDILSRLSLNFGIVKKEQDYTFGAKVI